MTNYLNKVKDAGGGANIYLEEYNKRIRGKNIYLVGDSAINRMTQTEIDLMIDAMPDCKCVNTGLSPQWADVYTTITQITGTPQIMLILCGSNELVAPWLVADYCGAPDIALQAGDPNDSTAFNYMRLVYSYVRTRWPRCEIYLLQRSNHPNKRRSAWYYFKYYEAAIAKEWGVPVIDINDILNLTYWNAAQQNIYVDQDLLHWTDAMYQRLLMALGYMIESQVTVCDMELPGCFYVPDSVLPYPNDIYDPANYAAVVDWVFQHCYTRASGNQGASLQGGAIVRNPGVNSTVFFEFQGNGYYSVDMTSYSGCRSFILRPDHVYYMESDGTDVTHLNTMIMTESLFDANDGGDVATWAEGDYVMLGAVAQACTNLPINSSGGHLIIRRNKTRIGSENGNGLFIWHYYQGNRMFIGTNVGTGTIGWKEVTAA